MEDRLQNSGSVMGEILNIPDNIPQDLLDKAKCVVVIPSVLKAAFIVGGTYGRGALVCRSGNGYSGAWGAPASDGNAQEGGSVVGQIGRRSDLFCVLLIMNDHGANSLLHSKVKLGGDVSAAAGPVGRTAEANTDAYLRSEILTYSRARGLFAGVSLEGASLRPDDEGNDSLYGRRISASEIVAGPPPAPPAAAQQLDALLEKASHSTSHELTIRSCHARDDAARCPSLTLAVLIPSRQHAGQLCAVKHLPRDAFALYYLSHGENTCLFLD